MRVLLTGANGFIGGALLSRLLLDGHEVVAVTRSPLAPRARLVVAHLDLRDAVTAEVWLPLLEGVDAVVNCAGVLQDGTRDSTRAVHTAAPVALFTACAKAGVRRVVQVSAIGVDRATPSEFSRSKAQGDQALMASPLDWVILRPSVVLGKAAYGGSALFRGLAALPIAVRIEGTGALQVVQLDQLVDTILFFLRPGAPAGVQLEIAGPDRLTFADVVAAYRQWLGFAPAHQIAVPAGAMRLVYALGDVAGRLGWRSPMRSTARLELERGAIGDPGPWFSLTGIVPQSLERALAAHPAGVQERWFARLYVLKPVIFTTLAVFWVATGLVSLGPGWSLGLGIMAEGGVTGGWAQAAIVAGAFADILIGLGIAVRRTARLALISALVLSLIYVVVGTVLVPALWIEPLGPLLKIGPIIAVMLVALAILEDR